MAISVHAKFQFKIPNIDIFMADLKQMGSDDFCTNDASLSVILTEVGTPEVDI